MIPLAIYERSLRAFLQPIGPFLDDAAVSEVLINGPQDIYIEKRGRLIRTDARFDSEEALCSALRGIAQFVGRPLDEDHPILEARLPDGSRVQAVLSSLAAQGPVVAIRRFSRETLTVDRLVALGALTPDAAALLKSLVACKQNLLVAGGTGSGKSSLLNALSCFIADHERIVVIEDARELRLQRPHVVQLETRPGDAGGRGAIGVRDLFKATLRLRPDRIVLGEIRAGEALDLVQAMTSGHGGCLATIHASYPTDVLHRLETMALMSGVDVPLFALRAQVASAVNVIAQTARMPDGSRRVTHITEVIGCDPQRGYLMQDLYALVHDVAQPSGASPRLAATGLLPRCREALRIHGQRLPPAMLAAADQGDGTRVGA